MAALEDTHEFSLLNISFFFPKLFGNHQSPGAGPYKQPKAMPCKWISVVYLSFDLKNGWLALTPLQNISKLDSYFSTCRFSGDLGAEQVSRDGPIGNPNCPNMFWMISGQKFIPSFSRGPHPPATPLYRLSLSRIWMVWIRNMFGWFGQSPIGCLCGTLPPPNFFLFLVCHSLGLVDRKPKLWRLRH